MKYYLSSYRLGNEIEKLKSLLKQTSGKFGYIPNALDSAKSDTDRLKNHIEKDMNSLKELGVEIELLDLKDYFGKESELKDKLAKLGGVYVSGGNTFILRQAMQISGFDKALVEMSDREDFVYCAYSAGVCVLGPTLRAYAIVDDSTEMPYSEIKETIWEGLGILDFIFEPHYRSDHPESETVEKEVQFCIDNKLLFKTYKDGEVLIIE